MSILQLSDKLYAFKTVADDLIKFDTSKNTVKLNRWDECSFLFELPTTATAKVVGDVISVGGFSLKQTPVKSPFNEFGGLDFITAIPSKPATNKIYFDIESNNVRLDFQPSLTKEYYVGQKLDRLTVGSVTDTIVKDTKGGEITRRPDHIVNSIAVSHATKGGFVTEKESIKGLRSGKLGHLYRMRDSLGRWADWEIISKTQIALVISQDSLDAGVYPLYIYPVADSWGYTTVGGSTATFTEAYYARCHLLINRTASTGDTITKFSLYGNAGGTTARNVETQVYSISGGAAVSRLGAIAVIPSNSTTPQWWDSAAVSHVMSNGVVYGMAFGFYQLVGTGMNFTAYYDAQTGGCTRETSVIALGTTWSTGDAEDRKYTHEVTYTPGAAGGIVRQMMEYHGG